MIKSIKFMALCSLLFGAVSCLEKEYEPAPPQLKIIVQETSGFKVPNATVKLFENESSYLSDSVVVNYGLTDSLGTVVFIELEENIYYFSIEKGSKNNSNSNYFFKEPLISGERKVVVTSIF